MEDACRLYKFNWTCDEFDEWMKEKEAALNPDADMLDAEAAKVQLEMIQTTVEELMFPNLFLSNGWRLIIMTFSSFPGGQEAI